MPVWMCFQMCVFSFFFFFSLKITVYEQYIMFTYCIYTIHVFKNIKNGSHGIIYIFKNYFITVFSIFSFRKNKLYSNGSYITVFNIFVYLPRSISI